MKENDAIVVTIQKFQIIDKGSQVSLNLESNQTKDNHIM